MEESKRNEITSKLLAIDEDLQRAPYQHPSLMTFDGGIAHYYAHRYFCTQDLKYLDLCFDKVEKGIEFSSEHAVDFGFSNGIAGTTWLIKFLIRHKLIDSSSIDTSETDLLIYKSALNDISAGHYDLLDGMIGKAMVFLEDSNLTHYLTDLTTKLVGISINSIKNRITWYDYYTTQNYANNSAIATQTNLGMAHGVPSILFFLSLVYEKGILKDSIEEILLRASETLLSEEKKSDERTSSFPNDSNQKNNSRLAWCYGDLGIVLSLFKVSEVLNNKTLKCEALRILEKASLRRIEDSGIEINHGKNIFEKGFCHGVAGISHIFNRLNCKFKSNTVSIANDYWLGKLLEPSKRIEHYFSFEKVKDKGEWYEDRSLLSGSAGVGLVLMSHISKEIPNWDNCLYTDI